MIEEGTFGEVTGNVRKVLPIVRSRLAQMSAMVDQMLETARLEEDRLQLVPRDVDLRELVRTAVAAVEPLAGPAHRLVVEECAEAVPVRVDAGRVATILANILDNAVKYSPSGGEVRCTVGAGAATARVVVSDQGLGIAERDLARLFSRFGRIVTSDNSHISGTGLGLYLARTLARLHGGDITVRSSVGAGSEFTLTLPLASRPGGRVP